MRSTARLLSIMSAGVGPVMRSGSTISRGPLALIVCVWRNARCDDESIGVGNDA
jgi:hypothetical protein